MNAADAAAIAHGLELARVLPTTAQIGELLLRPNVTTADVLAQLDRTDAAIRQALEEN